MKRIITILVLVTVSLSINAQSWQWSNAVGGSLDDGSTCVTTDASGNVYMAGSFKSTSITFGSTTLTNNAVSTKDIFLVKYDASGTVLWAVNPGGSGDDVAYGITTDASGNVYITGSYTSSSIQFGSTTALTNNGSEDIFIAKYDASGTALMSIAAGGSGQDCTTGISVDGSGNILVAGYFISPTIQIGSTTLYSVGNKDVLVAKFNSSGVAQWAKSSGGTSHDWAIAIATDASGNSYVTGSFRSSAGLAFGSVTLTHVGYYDFFLIKFDASGNAVWGDAASGGASSYGHDAGNGIVVDGTGNIYVTGYFDASGIQFGTTTALTNNGIFLVKYNNSGTAQWAVQAGGTSSSPYDMSNAIAIDGSSNLYIVGYFNSSYITFGSTTLQSNGNKETFIAKYDASGNALWADIAGGYSDDQAFGVAVDASNNVYITGTFDSPSMTFGSNASLGNSGDFDIYIAKYGSGSSATNSTAATSATASVTSFCPGGSSTLSFTGGTLGTAANWYWYSGTCGGTLIGSGTTYVVTPAITTDYFVRAEGTANTTSCASITITVNTLSVLSTNITASLTIINQGATTTLSEVGGVLGTGATWNWYENTCSGTSLGNTAVLTVAPTVTTTYFIRAEGTCNTTSCISIEITVIPTYIYNVYSDENNISIYPNPANTSFTVNAIESNVLVKLFNVSGQLIKEQSLNNNNVIDVSDIEKGIYLIEIITANNSIHKTIIIE